MDWITQPWPWYVAGPLIGLMVPTLLLVGNKAFGVSSTLRQVCAMCIPVKEEYFSKYDWKSDSWNLLFVLGVFFGGAIAGQFLIADPNLVLSENTIAELSSWGISDFSTMQPQEYFSWDQIGEWKTIILVLLGGFFVGFGARYAGGCTSGHAIMGLSQLSLGSLVAVIGFFIGGLFMTYFVLPHFFAL